MEHKTDNKIIVRDIAEAIEAFAPLSLQASYDNSGLIVGEYSDEVRGVLIAVDLSEEVIAEAIELGVNMIVTHHPIIFNPLKRLNSANYVERSVKLAIKSDIIIYAAHTNLDSAVGGLSWRFGNMLGLEQMSALDSDGYGVVGDLKESVKIDALLQDLSQKFRVAALRHSDVFRDDIRRVAICTGSGGSLLGSAIASGADLYITADLRYNDFFSAQRSITMVDIGHYESEYCVIEIIFDILSKKMFNFALHKSLRGTNPVHYRAYPLL